MSTSTGSSIDPSSGLIRYDRAEPGSRQLYELTAAIGVNTAPRPISRSVPPWAVGRRSASTDAVTKVEPAIRPHDQPMPHLISRKKRIYPVREDFAALAAVQLHMVAAGRIFLDDPQSLISYTDLAGNVGLAGSSANVGMPPKAKDAERGIPLDDAGKEEPDPLAEPRAQGGDLLGRKP